MLAANLFDLGSGHPATGFNRLENLDYLCFSKP